MIKTTYRAMIAYCVTGWFISVKATEYIPTDLLNLPWLSILVAGLISMWGGFISTIMKLHKDASGEEAPKLNIKWEVFKDLITSMTAGFAAFLIGMWQKLDNIWFFSLLLLFSGILGAKFLDLVGESIMVRVKAFINPGPREGS